MQGAKKINKVSICDIVQTKTNMPLKALYDSNQKNFNYIRLFTNKNKQWREYFQ